MSKKTYGVIASGACAALLLAGCGPTDPNALSGGGSGGEKKVGETWEEIEKLAEEEGTLNLSVMPLPGFEKWAEYADEQLETIDLEVTSISPETFIPRVVTEQDNGSYLWDVMVGPLTNTYAGLHPDYLAEAEPILSDLPEDVTADDKWAGGFDQYSDPDDPRSFISEYMLGTAIYVNRDKISEAQLSKPEDLLKPEWKGDICINDPRLANQAALGLTWFMENEQYGEEFVTDLLSNQDVILTDSITATSESFAQERCSIAIGADARTLDEYKDSGLDVNYELLDDYGNYLLGWGFSMLKDGPNPNATRVFLAWALSEEGQQAYVDMVRADATTRLEGVEPGEGGESKVDYDNLEEYNVRAGTTQGAEAVVRLNKLAEELLG